MAFLLVEDNNCAKLFWNPCTNVQVMLRTSSIHVYDHFDLYLTPMTLTFNLREKMFQMALLLVEDINCAKIILKSIHKCTSYGPDKLNIWPFWLYLTPVTLIFNLAEKCFKWHFSSSRAKTVHNYFEIHAQMYKLCSGQAQYMYMTILTFIWSLWPWPSTYLNGTSPPKGQQLCQIVLKSMHYCTSYGPDGGTHIHRTKIVTTMSHLPASGLDKNR